MKNPQKQFATILIVIISVWLYVVTTFEYGRYSDIPLFVFGLILAVLIVGTYRFMVTRVKKTGGDPSILRKRYDPSDNSERKLFWGTVIGMLSVAVLAFGLAFITVTIIDDETRRENTAFLTTCARDASNIKKLPVNKTITLQDGTIIIVQNVIYNVPQSDEHPQEITGYYCGKSTYVEVAISNLPTNANLLDTLSKSDFLLTADSAIKPGVVSDENADSSKEGNADYRRRQNLPALRLNTVGDDETTTSGWLTFAITNSSTNKDSKLTIVDPTDKQRRNLDATTIILPSYQ